MLNSIIIKPAGPDCNLDCTYCFYLEKSDYFNDTKVHRMTLKTLEAIVKQAMQYGSSYFSFAWQGGEPTLMGLPFYKKAVEYQEKYGLGKRVGNGLQTNGILLTNEWAKFLSKYNFLVGISLDGPKHIHDHYRVRKSGNGTWQKVHDNAKKLIAAGVDTNALTVVNDYSAEFPEEIYNFNKELGLNYMQFIPCIETDKGNPNDIASFSVSAEKYGIFLIKLFDLWYSDINNGIASTSVRYFDSIFHNYVGLDAPDCTLAESCGSYLVVEYDGSVYSCDFYVQDDWNLGNVMEGRLDEMFNSDRQIEFGNLKANLPLECKTCEWLKKCQGGCTKDRIKNSQDILSNHFCLSYKMFFQHADSKLKELANQWHINQQR